MPEEKSLDEIKKIWPKEVPDIKNVPKYIKKYKEDLIVIKYGGNVLIDRNIFNNFIEDIDILNKLGLSIIVVHGGGPRIERELKKENIQTKFINGLRVTDEKVIKIVERVLIDFNNDIVDSLNKKDSRAISINTKINNIISVIPDKQELGFVGVPDKINSDIINNIISQNQIPIVAPLGLSKHNQTYNINGDTAAGAIARSMKSRRLMLLTDIDGVLDNNDKLISEINTIEAKELINTETIHGGMIPKVKTCIDAINNGVRAVVILDGRKPHSILFELFSDKGSGTLIRK